MWYKRELCGIWHPIVKCYNKYVDFRMIEVPAKAQNFTVV